MVEPLKDVRVFNNLFSIPSGYKEIIENVQKTLANAGYKARISDYANEKKKLDLKGMDVPEPVAKMQLEDFQLQNSIMFLQANYFGSLINTSPPETRPLIAHYAEHSLFGFFVNSIVSYQDNTRYHGLHVETMEPYLDSTIDLKKHGFFPRIVDCYSILDAYVEFSKFQYDNTLHSFRQLSAPAVKYPFWDEPSITLRTVLDMRQNLPKMDGGHQIDVLDFLLIFFASSFARYRPHVWHKIVRGYDGPEYAWFQHSFDRFDILKRRLIGTLVKLSVGHHPTTLSEPDILFDADYDIH